MTAAFYSECRRVAADRSTRHLRRVERRFRALVARDVVTAELLTAWVAVRDELRERGRQVPEPDERPRFAWWRGRRSSCRPQQLTD